MGATLTEKLLARSAGIAKTHVGQLIEIEPDVILSHDNTSAIAELFERLPHKQLKYPERLAITLDHAVPAPTPKHAINHAKVREFVKQHQIKNFFEVGRGICHQVFCEEGIIGPGLSLLGADSHSTHYGWLGAFSAGVGRSEVAALWATGKLWLRVPETIRITLEGQLQTGVMSKDFTLTLIGELSAEGSNYQAVEFDGDGVTTLTPDSRMVLTNMMAEMGAKNACIAPDEITWNWIETQLQRNNPDIAQERLAYFREQVLYPDVDADYSQQVTINLDEIEPIVACPHRVDNTVRVSELSNVNVDVGFIGTCTNGRLEDIAVATEVIRGKKLRSRLLVIPASSQILRDATEAGYITELIDAGATIGVPGCGPCMGNHMGVLAPNEVCISSANRNFQGRMGQRDADIYLANPAVVAASALTGAITHPRDL